MSDKIEQLKKRVELLPCPFCGSPGEIANEHEQLRHERDALYGYVNGLLGLLQLVRSRDDMPKAISRVLNTNHRATDAAAYLTQIVPPADDIKQPLTREGG